jgi:hypothetical protein
MSIPTISPVPNLGTSGSVNPCAKDPNSTDCIASNLQAMKDQARADRVYDAELPVKKDGFQNYSPWITTSQACKRIQGFQDYTINPYVLSPFNAFVFGVGAVLLLSSFY